MATKSEDDTIPEEDIELEVDEKQEQISKDESLGVDEVYCTSCGEVIKEEAEICPHCGVRQKGGNGRSTVQSTGQSRSGTIPDRRQYELEKIASKDTTMAILLGIFISPLGYGYVGKWWWALLNFVTLNYALLGFIIVPIHVWKMMKDSREELRMAGVGGY